jgi:hypothetical protein
MQYSNTARASFEKFLADDNEENGAKPTAAGTLMRCSDAGNCLRQRGFAAAKFPEAHSFDTSTLIAFSLGTSMHELLQESIGHVHGGEFEKVVDLSPLGVSLSGSSDGVVEVDGQTRLLEIKTCGAYPFKLAKQTGLPKRQHVAQAALYAMGTPEVTHLWMVYLAKESAFKGHKAGETIEWVIELDEELFDGFTPRQIAEQELDNFRSVQQSLSEEMLPDAVVFDDDGVDMLVEKPPAYGSKGKPWNCCYCRYQSICEACGPTEVSLQTAKVHAGWLTEEETV